jgi:hypothetical protein
MIKEQILVKVGFRISRRIDNEGRHFVIGKRVKTNKHV